MALKTLDPKEYITIVGGQIMQGFAEGTHVKIEYNEDAVVFSPDTQGSGTRTLSRNKSGRVTLTLQQTSPSNAVLDAFHTAQELAGGGLFPFLFKDGSGNDIAIALTMWSVKRPSAEYSNELLTREWILETDNLEMHILGHSA